MQILVRLGAALTVLLALSIVGARLIGHTLPKVYVQAQVAAPAHDYDIDLVVVGGYVHTKLRYGSVPDDLPGWSPWSPDGKKIVFVSYNLDDQDIYVMDIDGSNLRNLSNYPGADLSPVWSPDSQQIAFISWRDENFEIYAVHVDGTQLRNVSHRSGDDLLPVWSPDSRYITFESRGDGTDGCYVTDLRAHTLNARPVQC